MIDFLTAVWPVEIAPFVEIRAIKEGKVNPKFFDPNEIEEMLAMQRHIAQMDENGWDVYYGVLPRVRTREQGLAGRAEDTAGVSTVLWVDIDAKHMDIPFFGDSKGEAWHRINGLDQTPSIIVDSGNGYHAYWLLDRTVEWRTAEAIMRGLAEHLGGDAVYDAPRILRVPGTHNHKNDPPTPVRLMRFDRDRVWRPGAFVDFRDRGLEIMEPPVPAFNDSIGGHEDRRPFPAWLFDKITQHTPKGSRSEAAFSTILWLLRYGCSEDEIIRIFAANPDGVGEKFWEKGGMSSPRAMKWLHGSIQAARRVA